MKTILAILIFLPICLAADDAPPAIKPATAPATTPTTTQATTRPAARAAWRQKLTAGMPETRIGGVSRGGDQSDVAIFILAPSTHGLTAKPLPTLFWHLTQPADKIVLTLVRNADRKTMLKMELPKARAGLHRLDLAALSKSQNLDVALLAQSLLDAAGKPLPDAPAAWNLALRLPRTQSPNPPATASIARVPAATGSSTSAALIEQELWYDAITALMDDIRANPIAADPRSQLRDLLSQVRVYRFDVPDQAADPATKLFIEKAQAEEKRLLDALLIKGPIELEADNWRPYAP